MSRWRAGAAHPPRRTASGSRCWPASCDTSCSTAGLCEAPPLVLAPAVRGSNRTPWLVLVHSVINSVRVASRSSVAAASPGGARSPCASAVSAEPVKSEARSGRRSCCASTTAASASTTARFISRRSSLRNENTPASSGRTSATRRVTAASPDRSSTHSSRV